MPSEVRDQETALEQETSSTQNDLVAARETLESPTKDIEDLRARYQNRLDDIAALTREFEIQMGELRQELEAERHARARIFNTRLRAAFVLALASPFLKPFLNKRERELYRDDPFSLFRDANHPMMKIVGRLAGMS